jgi:hypothetical protein
MRHQPPALMQIIVLLSWIDQLRLRCAPLIIWLPTIPMTEADLAQPNFRTPHPAIGYAIMCNQRRSHTPSPLGEGHDLMGTPNRADLTANGSVRPVIASRCTFSEIVSLYDIGWNCFRFFTHLGDYERN